MKKTISIVLWLVVLTFSAAAQESSIYLRRPGKFIGVLGHAYIEINGEYVGDLTNNSAIRVSVPSGSILVGVRFAIAEAPYFAAKAMPFLNPYMEMQVTATAGGETYLMVDWGARTIEREADGTDKLYAKAKERKLSGKRDNGPAMAASGQSVIAAVAGGDTEVTYAIGDYIPTQQDGKWGYMQFEKWVIDARFDQAWPFIEGLALVQLYGKYGFINKNGESVIPFRFEKALPFSEGLAAVCLNGKWGFIDATGLSAIPYKYTEVTGFDNGLAAAVLGDKIGYIDKDDVWYENRAALHASYRGFAKQYIESRVNEWQKKGRYEKTDDWRARVNDENRKKLIDSLTLQVQDLFIAEQSRNLQTDLRIGAYDADNEVFLINDSRFGNLLVHVPVSEAEAFENHFDEYTRSNRYCVDGDDLGLAESTFTLGDRTYRYNNQSSLNFTSLDIDYSFESVDFDAVPTNASKGNQAIASVGISAPRTADIDMNVPVGITKRDNTFAVIIANEQYRREVAVEYASNDGESFREYCIKTLGIPERNIHMVKDATYLDMVDQVDWITGVAKSYQGDASLIFYYAGHGIPDESSKEAYLLPVDGRGTNVSTGYRLGELYDRLGKNPTKSTLVLLDACFSGSQRDGTMLASARGVAIKAKTAQPVGQMVVLSAAQGDETAYPYREKNHGLFTYFLLKKLQESRGEVTLGELSSYVSDQVSRHSIVENAKSQTPSVTASTTLEGDWQEMKFAE